MLCIYLWEPGEPGARPLWTVMSRATAGHDQKRDALFQSAYSVFVEQVILYSRFSMN